MERNIDLMNNWEPTVDFAEMPRVTFGVYKAETRSLTRSLYPWWRQGPPSSEQCGPPIGLTDGSGRRLAVPHICPET